MSQNAHRSGTLIDSRAAAATCLSPSHWAHHHDDLTALHFEIDSAKVPRERRVEIAGNVASDLVEELPELAEAMLRVTAADHRANRDITSSEKASRAVASVAMTRASSDRARSAVG